jgi:FkbM family methyltransferase
MITNKPFVLKTVKNNNENKTILDKSLGFDYTSKLAPTAKNTHKDGWDSEKHYWYDLYMGLYLIDTFKINKNHAIDIGVFKGFYSSVYARHFENVDSFEANPYAFSHSKLNFNRQGLENITLHNKGVWSSNTELNFYCKFNDESKTLICGQSTTLETLEQEEGLTTEIIKAKMVTLDSFSFKPSFIKIDAEGSEIEILKGAMKTLVRYKPLLQIENDTVLANNPEIEQMLLQIGYNKVNLEEYKHVYGNITLSDDYYINN